MPPLLLALILPIIVPQISETFYANSIRNNSFDIVSRTKYHRSPFGEARNAKESFFFLTNGD